MKHVKTTGKRKLFQPLLESAGVQAAMMVLKRGESSSERVEDEHPGAEQWLLVLSGSGRVKGKHRSIALREGSLLLIEKREPHQIVNTGKVPMVTMNFYSPPAYTSGGEVKPSVRPKG